MVFWAVLTNSAIYDQTKHRTCGALGRLLPRTLGRDRAAEVRQTPTGQYRVYDNAPSRTHGPVSAGTPSEGRVRDWGEAHASGQVPRTRVDRGLAIRGTVLGSDPKPPVPALCPSR